MTTRWDKSGKGNEGTGCGGDHGGVAGVGVQAALEAQSSGMPPAVHHPSVSHPGGPLLL